MTYSVYTLTDPRDSQVRYVGITTNPEQRFKDHIGFSDYAPAKEAWIKAVLADNATPFMSIIDQADNEKDARALEAHWILEFHLAGSMLVNKEVYNLQSTYETERAVARLRARALNANPEAMPLQLKELQHINSKVAELTLENEQLRVENARLRSIIEQVSNLAQELNSQTQA